MQLVFTYKEQRDLRPDYEATEGKTSPFCRTVITVNRTVSFILTVVINLLFTMRTNLLTCSAGEKETCNTSIISYALNSHRFSFLESCNKKLLEECTFVDLKCCDLLLECGEVYPK